MTETLKITQPLYVGQIAPMIQKYYEKVNVHKLNCISYETLYTYISNTVQFGGDMAEVWVTFKDDEPVGFALWRVMGLPYQGTVYCEHLFKSVKDHEVAIKLGQEFVKFGKKHRAPYYSFDAVNESVSRVLRKLASELNLDFIETGQTNFIGRHKNG